MSNETKTPGTCYDGKDHNYCFSHYAYEGQYGSTMYRSIVMTVCSRCGDVKKMDNPQVTPATPYHTVSTN